METINGFAIIASHSRDAESRVILGAREDEHGFEYVTAVAALRSTEPREWFWGHYFRNDLVGAVADLNDRTPKGATA